MADLVKPPLSHPGVYVTELSPGSPTIPAVPTSRTLFVGRMPAGPTDGPREVSSLAEVRPLYGTLDPSLPLCLALQDFFQHGGVDALVLRRTGTAGAPLTPEELIGDAEKQSGVWSVDALVNLVVVPPDDGSGALPDAVLDDLLTFCAARKAFLVCDAPRSWGDDLDSVETDAAPWLHARAANTDGRNGAAYFPWLKAADGSLRAPSGAIAGIYSTTDRSRGVWHAPAGMTAALNVGLQAAVDDTLNESLNALGLNCLRSIPSYGEVVWGARTLRGATPVDDSFKFVNVRRLLLYIEQSLDQGLKWTVFEVNDEALWAAIRAQVGQFLTDLKLQGAFYEDTVTCDATTTTPVDIAEGRVNVIVKIAPVRPGEFVVLTFEARTVKA